MSRENMERITAQVKDRLVKIEPEEVLLMDSFNYLAGDVLDGKAKVMLSLKGGRVSAEELTNYLTDPGSMGVEESKMVELYLREQDQRN